MFVFISDKPAFFTAWLKAGNSMRSRTEARSVSNVWTSEGVALRVLCSAKGQRRWFERDGGSEKSETAQNRITETQRTDYAK